MELDIIRIAGIALVGVVTAGIVKNIKPEFTIYLVMATIVLIFFLTVDKLRVVFDFLNTIYSQITYGKTFFPILLKVLAVA